ncbi:MAG TPA: HD domain-containing protein [Firmicutes bacterium]|nr:HD domain-containing protein [Bacillota bacterium]
MPEYVKAVAERLRAAGYEVYVVGGAPRDLALGQVPDDWDLATTATPMRVQELFADSQLVLTGNRFGTVGIVSDGRLVQVTTFRSEADYADKRHPGKVEFVHDIQSDLSRRDFTVNAIAIRWPDCDIVDPFCGIEDIRKGVIRAVGDPNQRFAEDALRMLRAARFAAEYDWEVEPVTLRAIRANAASLACVSVERIRDELCKLLLGTCPSRGLALMFQTGMMDLVIPEFSAARTMEEGVRFHHKPVIEHTLEVVDLVRPKLAVRFAALLHDIAKPSSLCLDNGEVHFYGHDKAGADMAVSIMTRLKMDKATIEETSVLVREHMRPIAWEPAPLRRLIRKLGSLIFDWLDLKRADLIASGEPRAAEAFGVLEERIKQILEAKEPLHVSDLAVSGHDVMEALELKPGPLVGEALAYLLEKVIEDPARNRKEVLVSLLHEWWNERIKR